MRLSCMRVARLLTASAAGLSPAEALRLEEHLATCPTCRDDSALLERMRSLSEPMRPLSERARVRVIDTALRRAGEQAARAPAAARRRTPLILGAAAVAVAVSYLWFLGEWGDPDKKPEPMGSEVAGVPPLAATALLLESVSTPISGKVTLEVAATPVEVVARPGTRVRVEGTRVRVVAGGLQVVAASGRVIDKLVVAGGSWELTPEITSRLEQPVIETPAPAGARERPAAPVDTAELLQSATRHLAADDVTTARADLERVLDARPPRPVRAEAELLLAQATLMDGDVRGAVDRYLQVAERYPNLPAAERARFQAGKTEANFGSPAHARALLGSYLQQYPEGRFRAEALRRLDRLD